MSAQKPLAGLTVFKHESGACYIPLPDAACVPIDGGCGCPTCKADPTLARWDTLVVPQSGTTFMVHWPSMQAEAPKQDGFRRV